MRVCVCVCVHHYLRYMTVDFQYNDTKNFSGLETVIAQSDLMVT